MKEHELSSTEYCTFDVMQCNAIGAMRDEHVRPVTDSDDYWPGFTLT